MKKVLLGLVFLGSFPAFSQVVSNDGIGVFDNVGKVTGKNVNTITVESARDVDGRFFNLQEMKDQCEIKFNNAIEKINLIPNAVIVNTVKCHDYYLPEFSYTHEVKGEIYFIR